MSRPLFSDFMSLRRASSTVPSQPSGAHLDELGGDADRDLRRGLPTDVQAYGQMDSLDLRPGKSPPLQLLPQEGLLFRLPMQPT